MVIALGFKTEAADLIKNAFKYFYVFRFDLCLLIKKIFVIGLIFIRKLEYFVYLLEANMQ